MATEQLHRPGRRSLDRSGWGVLDWARRWSIHRTGWGNVNRSGRRTFDGARWGALDRARWWSLDRSGRRAVYWAWRRAIHWTRRRTLDRTGRRFVYRSYSVFQQHSAEKGVSRIPTHPWLRCRVSNPQRGMGLIGEDRASSTRFQYSVKT